MARFEVDLQKEFKQIADLDIPTKDLDNLAKKIVNDIKAENIRAGISPITGRRFPAYKNPDKYPGDRKAPRPVNLKLSGDFLRNFVGSAEDKTFIFEIRGQKNKDKELGHREGANTQPQRPIIPTDSEGFSRAIMVDLEREMQKLLDNL